MCGIAGVLKIHPPGRPPPPHAHAIPDAWLDLLDDSIRHRGPDGGGRFRDRAIRPDGTIVDVALVHRRLSIIDHEGGAQPMVLARGADGRPALIQPTTSLRARSVSDGHDPINGARSVSDGSGAFPEPDRDETPRSRSGLFSELFGQRESRDERLTTIDATRHHDPDLLAVVFNGCIYNHRELREELEAAGHRFHTDHADTEVLLHGWKEWRRAMLLRLRSMHAFMLWDRSLGTLLIARDRFGEKPLYYGTNSPDAKNASLFVFSSTLPGIVRVLHAADRDAVKLESEMLAYSITYGHAEPATPWDRIWNLPASGAYFFPDPDRTDAPLHPFRDEELAFAAEHERREAERRLPLRPRRSFTLASARSVARRTLDPLDSILREAVAERLEADVPIACLLSGGVDSSLVSAFAAAELGEMTTITVRMPDPRYDESDHARRVAEHLGTHHVVVDARPDAASDLIHLVEQLGLPFGDSSLLPTYWACRAAGRVARVVLTGDGGDEMFAGYDRYMLADGLEKTVGPLAVPVAYLLPRSIFPQRDPTSRSSRLARLIPVLRRYSYRTLLAIFDPADTDALLGPRFNTHTWFDMPKNAHEATLADREFTLPGDYLRKVDTASMAVPIETRAPFLDDRVRRARDEIGDDLTAGGRKGLLRAIARRYLPREIVDRPKQGFAIPIGAWFRSDFGGLRQLLHDHLESADPFPGIAEAGVEIRIPFVRQMLREHDAAGEPSRNPWHGRDHAQRLYMLLVLSIWCRWLRRIPNAPEPATR
jgi:asparagine synthase (glutamine-hydrolysing)